MASAGGPRLLLLQQCTKGARRAGYRAFTCSVCGKEVVILRKLYGSRRGKICSCKCAGLARRGQRFPWSFKLGAEHPRWTGGLVKYYGPNWRGQQRLARERDQVCQRCGKPPQARKALDVHHRIPFKKFGLVRYEEANLALSSKLLGGKCLIHTGTEGGVPGSSGGEHWCQGGGGNATWSSTSMGGVPSIVLHRLDDPILRGRLVFVESPGRMAPGAWNSDRPN